MDLTVVDEGRRCTTRCHHAFSCLSTGKCGTLLLCEIQKRFDKNMLFVKTTDEERVTACPYKMTSGTGDEHICTCPTHHSLYLQQQNLHDAGSGRNRTANDGHVPDHPMPIATAHKQGQIESTFNFRITCR